MSQPLSLRPDYGESDAALPRGEKSARPSAARVAERFRLASSMRSQGQKEAAVTLNPLDGLARPKALKIVQHIISKVDTRGLFRDAHWAPIQAIWRALEKQDLQWNINHSQYESEAGSQEPVRKVWDVWVPFTNAKGRADNIYIRIVASGAGSVKDPLEAYDVVAYAN